MSKKINKIVQREQAKIKDRLNRVPLLAPLVASFGLVAVLYGLEKIIDDTPLADQPLTLLLVGVVILIFTGAFYEKL